ncbi:MULTISPECIES: riboflavin synthase [Psychrobacillus]|uniref:Riboflavin synthase n=1 Tax=Psychrobacillus faecigallinarum TaxID=2762235 RepID=A0ABR8RDC6_9BACI|nr:riboflavin synthase [Psychrobacillus faecigallinarum]MBD7945734.1 riboflavin synthase [Psychrobacillus faecigallinarum]
MFTGIIEELGAVQQMNMSTQSMEISIGASKILEDVQLGDSIAVNGVCLTVKKFTNDLFVADVMPETVKSTSLQQLKKGSTVNLERAMSANGRFGGHIVSGHVDGVATILRKRPASNAVYIDLAMPKELLFNCLMKGSITIDGTSLTIFNVTDSIITVSLIPHTFKETVLGLKQTGEIVNIETDLIGKYVAKHLANQNTGKVTVDFLQKAGF